MAEKKKGGFINRLIMGTEKSEGYARSTLPSNRWELFWDIFKGRFGKLFLINVLVLLFCLLVAFLLFIVNNALSLYGSESAFSQNIGIGYPAVPDMADRRRCQTTVLSGASHLPYGRRGRHFRRRVRHQKYGLDGRHIHCQRFLEGRKTELFCSYVHAFDLFRHILSGADVYRLCKPAHRHGLGQ